VRSKLACEAASRLKGRFPRRSDAASTWQPTLRRCCITGSRRLCARQRPRQCRPKSRNPFFPLPRVLRTLSGKSWRMGFAPLRLMFTPRDGLRVESAPKWDPGTFGHTGLIIHTKSGEGWGPDRRRSGPHSMLKLRATSIRYLELERGPSSVLIHMERPAFASITPLLALLFTPNDGKPTKGACG
jgi:hypothetical protein